MTLWSTVALGLAVMAACSSEAAGDRRTACTKLRDHASELAVEQAGGSLDEEERRKHAQALTASAGDTFIRRCVEEWSDGAVECGLAAETADELKRCRQRR